MNLWLVEQTDDPHIVWLVKAATSEDATRLVCDELNYIDPANIRATEGKIHLSRRAMEEIQRRKR